MVRINHHVNNEVDTLLHLKLFITRDNILYDKDSLIIQ
jgi:hypothetical protein